MERLKSPLSVIFHNVSFALEELFASNTVEIKKNKLGKSIYELRNIYNDTIIKRKIEKIKEHIQEISESISGSVPTPVPSISTDEGSFEKSINESKYTALKKNEHVIHMVILATMFYFVDRGIPTIRYLLMISITILVFLQFLHGLST